MRGVVSSEGALVDVESETLPSDQSHSFVYGNAVILTQNGRSHTHRWFRLSHLVQSFCGLCFELVVISLYDSARPRSGTLRGDVSLAFVVCAISRLFRGEVDGEMNYPPHGR